MTESKILAGKTALITGGAKGQGAATARLFVTEGARVMIGDVDSEAGTHLAQEIGPSARFVQMDISNSEDWRRVMADCLEWSGKIDILFNNAAIYEWLGIEDTTDVEFERFWRVNQKGTFLGMRAAIDPMKENGGGSIINMGSVGGAGGYPNIFAYATSKWAIRGMTKCAARDLGKYGIRVNIIQPGVIDTDMIAHVADDVKEGWLTSMPLGRLGEPEDVAKVALFLASDASAYMTGTDITVDAGMTA